MVLDIAFSIMTALNIGSASLSSTSNQHKNYQHRQNYFQQKHLYQH
jgi:hypothetical protein